MTTPAHENWTKLTTEEQAHAIATALSTSPVKTDGPCGYCGIEVREPRMWSGGKPIHRGCMIRENRGLPIDKDRWDTWYRTYRPNITFSDDYMEGYVVTYHNSPDGIYSGENEAPIAPNLRITKEWDEYEQEELMVDLGITSATEITERFNRAFALRFGHVTLFDEETGREGSVYHISGGAIEILNHCTRWIDNIRKAEYWASGDDSYFDYCPDEIALIYQMLRIAGEHYPEGAGGEWESFLIWLYTSSPYSHEITDDEVDIVPFVEWDGSTPDLQTIITKYALIDTDEVENEEEV